MTKVVTILKPDIGIIDEKKKHSTFMSQECRSKLGKKMKYSPFFTDITDYTCKLNWFEVSSSGVINVSNKSTLNSLQEFIRKDLTESTFMQNINALALLPTF